MDNERDYVEARFWLNFAAEMLPDRAEELEKIKQELRDKLDPNLPIHPNMKVIW